MTRSSLSLLWVAIVSILSIVMKSVACVFIMYLAFPDNVIGRILK